MAIKGFGYFWSGLAEGLRSNISPEKRLWEMALLDKKYDKMWEYKQKELEERGKLQKDILEKKQQFQKEFILPLQEKNLSLKAYQAWLDELKTKQDIENNLNELLKAQNEITKILINSDAIDEEIAKSLGIEDISKAKKILRETLEMVNNKINNYIKSEKGEKKPDIQSPLESLKTQKTITKQTPNVVTNILNEKKVAKSNIPEI